MIAGALAISTAVASGREHLSNNRALERECDRYGLDYLEVLRAQSGAEFGNRDERRRWWDVAIIVAATGVFVWLGLHAVVPPIAMNMAWLALLSVVLVVSLMLAGWALWRNTRFS
jgi:hypothetical protein